MKSPKKSVPSLGSDLYKIPLSSAELPLVFCRLAVQLNVYQTSMVCFYSLPCEHVAFHFFGKLDFPVDYEMVFSQMELGGMSADLKIWKGP